MKISTKRRLYVAAIVCFLWTGNLGLTDDAIAQRGRCGNQTFCFDGDIWPICIPLPTTLPGVSSTWSGGYGFRIASSNCGASRCWFFFACRCGPGLGGSVCVPGSASSNGGESCSQEPKMSG